MVQLRQTLLTTHLAPACLSLATVGVRQVPFINYISVSLHFQILQSFDHGWILFLNRQVGVQALKQKRTSLFLSNLCNDFACQVGEVANEFDRVAYGKRCSTWASCVPEDMVKVDGDWVLDFRIFVQQWCQFNCQCHRKNVHYYKSVYTLSLFFKHLWSRVSTLYSVARLQTTIVFRSLNISLKTSMLILQVEDRGGAIKGAKRIDLYHTSHRHALRWGRRKLQVFLTFLCLLSHD